MWNLYESINMNQCLKSDKNIQESIQEFLCCKCQQFPRIILRNKSNLDHIYCYKCATDNKINFKISEGKLPLEKLVIDCFRFCGKTFTFESINEQREHESNCTSIIEFNGENTLPISDGSNILCHRCETLMNSQSHDCVFNLKFKYESKILI